MATGPRRDPDAYVDDWLDAALFKKMMRAEAIKRGLPYQQFECDDDEAANDLSTVHDATEDAKSFVPAEGEMFSVAPLENRLDEKSEDVGRTGRKV